MKTKQIVVRYEQVYPLTKFTTERIGVELSVFLDTDDDIDRCVEIAQTKVRQYVYAERERTGKITE